MFNQKTKTAIILTCLISIMLAPLTNATTYDVGISTGQWIKYGNVKGSGTSLPSDINDTDYMKIEITEVSGKNITLHLSGKYKNGANAPESGAKLNIETGWTNQSSASTGNFYVIAANLQENDTLPGQYMGLAMKINKTETRTYLGASRTVNIVNFTWSMEETFEYSFIQIYDKASGILLELTISAVIPMLPSSNIYMSFSATESNILGTGATQTVDNNMIYIAIAVIIIVVVAIVALKMRKKPSTTETPATKTQP